MRGVLTLVGFQAAWWANALLARSGRGELAALATLAFVAVMLTFARRRASMALLAVTAALLGVLVDGTLRALGLIGFPAATDAAPAPLSMIALWAALACALPIPFVSTRPALGALLGFIGGAAAYRGGAALGVLTLGPEPGASLAIGAAWAVAFPLLGALALALDSEHANRRSRTVPRTLLLLLALAATAPLWAPLGLIVDGARRRGLVTLRVAAFGLAFLAVEVWIIARALVAGVVLRGDRAALAERTYVQQAAFTRALLRAVSWCFRLRFDVQGDACVKPGPVVVVARHASIIDTLLPSVLLTQAHGIRLRFVLKRELREDPCLDFAGDRIPNHFVSRGRDDTAADLDAIRALASDMGADEGALIYPEGTRFTPAKRERAVAALDPAGELGARAAGLRRVLPPKPAGTGALLDGCPDADVVVLAHRGLEGFATVADIWRGDLVGATVHVRCWRIPRAQVPSDDAARARWLYDTWALVDAFVASGDGGAP